MNRAKSATKKSNYQISFFTLVPVESRIYLVGINCDLFIVDKDVRSYCVEDFFSMLLDL